MRIISKYKDYYDYLIGIRGIDNKIVIDRREGFIFKEDQLRHDTGNGLHREYRNYLYSKFRVAICGKLYTGLKSDTGILYWGDKIRDCGELDKKRLTINYKNDIHKRLGRIELEKLVLPTNLNEKYDCPILHVIETYSWKEDVQKYPRLKDLGLASWYGAEEIYNDIYNWIIAHNTPKIIDNRTDIEKVQSAGFDKIHSFRNTK